MNEDAKEPQLDRLATEAPNPRTTDLDRWSPLEFVRRVNEEDAQVLRAVRAEEEAIAATIEAAAEAIRGGGGVHYFGAGTSGRLGVLDASEIPPTFGAPPHYFVGHIAGGEVALRNAVEGAEDSRDMGRERVEELDLKAPSLVVALSASGRTPYCLGALEAARARGLRTVAITCNEGTAMAQVADIVIAPAVGPEVLTGSTRLKSGTAQKMVLNMISTGAMVRLGASYGNLMVGVTPTNAKLRVRAARLVRQITGREEGVDQALEAASFEVRTACVMLHHDLGAEAARAHLGAHEGSLRAALEATPA